MGNITMASTAVVTNQKAKQSQAQGEPAPINISRKEIPNEAEPSMLVSDKIEKKYGPGGLHVFENFEKAIKKLSDAFNKDGNQGSLRYVYDEPNGTFNVKWVGKVPLSEENKKLFEYYLVGKCGNTNFCRLVDGVSLSEKDKTKMDFALKLETDNYRSKLTMPITKGNAGKMWVSEPELDRYELFFTPSDKK